MDQQTLVYYRTHAAEVARAYDAAESGLGALVPLAFQPGQRVLDVGAGSGRDMSRLLARGVDMYGVEPCEALRAQALANHPELAGRLEPGALPALGRPFGGDFDGVLCAAVLMHLPGEEMFDAAFALRGVLREGGRLLVSVPRERPGLDAGHRDGHGRLFTPLAADYLQLLCERLGFAVVSRWAQQDARPEYSWWVMLFEVGGGVSHRGDAEGAEDGVDSEGSARSACALKMGHPAHTKTQRHEGFLVPLCLCVEVVVSRCVVARCMNAWCEPGPAPAHGRDSRKRWWRRGWWSAQVWSEWRRKGAVPGRCGGCGRAGLLAPQFFATGKALVSAPR